MDLKARIQTIVGTIQTEDPAPPLAFRYGRKSDENINADSGTFPAVVLIEPDQFGFTVDPQSGQVRERANVFIQFITLCEMGDQAEARYDSLQLMRKYAAEFIFRLNATNLFQDLAVNYPAVAIVDTYDANVCGVEINLGNLTSTQPERIC